MYERKSKTISLRISESLLKDIDAYIIKHYGKNRYFGGKSRSEFIIDCIYLKIKDK